MCDMDRYVVDVTYSGIIGAHKKSILSMNGEVWVLDCTAGVNVSFEIGGQTFPIKPLNFNQRGQDNSGNNICFGTVCVAFPRSPVWCTLTEEEIESSKQSSLGLKTRPLTGSWESRFVSFLSCFCPMHSLTEPFHSPGTLSSIEHLHLTELRRLYRRQHFQHD
jgi:hypothetical protein